MTEISTIDLTWVAIQSLAGSAAHDPALVSKALEAVERMGGKDPIPLSARMFSGDLYDRLVLRFNMPE
jgi:hypothetical protein